MVQNSNSKKFVSDPTCCWVEEDAAEDVPEAGVDVEVAGAMVADMASS